MSTETFATTAAVAHQKEIMRKIVAAYDRLALARSTRVPGEQTQANRELKEAIANARNLVHGSPWGKK
jgi:hypothetical protein